MTTEPTEFITIPEAASRLGCSRATMYGHMTNKRLTRYKTGNGYYVRVKASEVEELRQKLNTLTPVAED